MAIDWAVENVRLSLFSKAAVVVSDADWKLTGQEEAIPVRTYPEAVSWLDPTMAGG